MRRLLCALTLGAAAWGSLSLTLPAAAQAWDWPGKLTQAEQNLNSSKPQERVAALRGLVVFPPQQVTPLLRRALEDPSPEVQLAALDALRMLGDRAASPAVLPLLNAADPLLRQSAARTLGALGDPASLDALIRSLGDPDADVREAAVRALGQLGLRGGLQAVAASLLDAEARVVVAALDVLADAGDRSAVFALLEKTRDPSLRLQVHAIEALGRLGDPRAARPLAALLHHDNREVRSAAIDALGRLAWPEATPLLLRLLWAADPADLTPRILAALGRIGDPRSIEPLIEILRRSPAAPAAADALKRIGPAVIEPLLTLLLAAGPPQEALLALDVLAWVARPEAGASPEQLSRVADALHAELERRRLPRRALLLALGGTRDPRAAEPLLAATLEPPVPTLAVADDALPLPAGLDASRAPLIDALAHLGDARVVAPLADLYPGLDPTDRAAALRLFEALRSDAALPVLERALREGEGAEPLQAARALGALGSPQAGRLLLAALTPDAPPDLALEIAYALGRCDSDAVRARLHQLALDGEPPLRGLALRALSDQLREHPDPTLLASLAATLEDTPRSPDALRAVDLLALGPPNDASLQALQTAFREGTPALRVKIVQTLGEWGDPRGLPLALEASESPATALRAEAAWTLGLLGDTAATPRLLNLLDDPGWGVALNAAAALGRLADPATRDPLRARLDGARGPLRANLLLALARLGEPPTLDTLRGLLRQRGAPWAEATLYALALPHGDAGRQLLEAELARDPSPQRRDLLRDLLGYTPAPPDGAPWTRFVFTGARGPLAGQRALVVLPHGATLARLSDPHGELRVAHPEGAACHLFPLDEVFSVEP